MTERGQIERAYTVSEIDELRLAVENHYLWGRYQPLFSSSGVGMSRSYNPSEMAVLVEQRVRTYMLAGITAADLLSSERGDHLNHEKEAADGGATPR